jgi:hypothetical protein
VRIGVVAGGGVVRAVVGGVVVTAGVGVGVICGVSTTGVVGGRVCGNKICVFVLLLFWEWGTSGVLAKMGTCWGDGVVIPGAEPGDDGSEYFRRNRRLRSVNLPDPDTLTTYWSLFFVSTTVPLLSHLFGY